MERHLTDPRVLKFRTSERRLHYFPKNFRHDYRICSNYSRLCSSQNIYIEMKYFSNIFLFIRYFHPQVNVTFGSGQDSFLFRVARNGMDNTMFWMAQLFDNVTLEILTRINILMYNALEKLTSVKLQQ